MSAPMFTVLLLVQVVLFLLLRSDMTALRSDMAVLRGDLAVVVVQMAELADVQLVPRVRRKLEACTDNCRPVSGHA